MVTDIEQLLPKTHSPLAKAPTPQKTPSPVARVLTPQKTPSPVARVLTPQKTPIPVARVLTPQKTPIPVVVKAPTPQKTHSPVVVKAPTPQKTPSPAAAGHYTYERFKFWALPTVITKLVPFDIIGIIEDLPIKLFPTSAVDYLTIREFNKIANTAIIDDPKTLIISNDDYRKQYINKPIKLYEFYRDFNINFVQLNDIQDQTEYDNTVDIIKNEKKAHNYFNFIIIYKGIRDETKDGQFITKDIPDATIELHSRIRTIDDLIQLTKANENSSTLSWSIASLQVIKIIEDNMIINIIKNMINIIIDLYENNESVVSVNQFISPVIIINKYIKAYIEYRIEDIKDPQECKENIIFIEFVITIVKAMKDFFIKEGVMEQFKLYDEYMSNNNLDNNLLIIETNLATLKQKLSAL